MFSSNESSDYKCIRSDFRNQCLSLFEQEKHQVERIQILKIQCQEDCENVEKLESQRLITSELEAAKWSKWQRMESIKIASRENWETRQKLITLVDLMIKNASYYFSNHLIAELQTWQNHQRLLLTENALTVCDVESELGLLRNNFKNFLDNLWELKDKSQEFYLELELLNFNDNWPRELVNLQHYSDSYKAIEKNKIAIELINPIQELMTSVLQHLLIVSKQPVCHDKMVGIIRTNCNIETEVSLLAGSQIINVEPITVKIEIVKDDGKMEKMERFECMVNEKMECRFCPSELKLMNKNLNADIVPDIRAYCAKLKLCKIKRLDKSASSQFVTEQKYRLLFSADINLGFKNKLPIYALSLPVVITSHSGQDQKAYGFLFREIVFLEKQEICGSRLFQLLHCRFVQHFGSKSKRGLSVNDFNFMAEKIFGIKLDNYDLLMVNAQRLFQEKMTKNVDFTFWQWFYQIMTTISKAIDLWNSNTIYGFLSKDQAETRLSSVEKNTVMLRISDQFCENIFISYLQINQERKIIHEPFCFEKFGQADLVNYLTNKFQDYHIYPDINKSTLVNIAEKCKTRNCEEIVVEVVEENDDVQISRNSFEEVIPQINISKKHIQSDASDRLNAKKYRYENCTGFGNHYLTAISTTPGIMKIESMTLLGSSSPCFNSTNARSVTDDQNQPCTSNSICCEPLTNVLENDTTNNFYARYDNSLNEFQCDIHSSIDLSIYRNSSYEGYSSNTSNNGEEFGNLLTNTNRVLNDDRLSTPTADDPRSEADWLNYH